MTTTADTLGHFLDVLRPYEDADGRLVARSIPLGERVVFGGQLMAQAIAVAGARQPDKSVMTVHITFTRGGDPTTLLDVEVDEILAGRSFGAVTVTFRQRGKVCARAQVQLSGSEPYVFRHAQDPPAVPGPDPAVAGPTQGNREWLTQVVDGIDVMVTDQEHPAALSVWSRWPAAPSDPMVGRQLLAWASDPWLIGTSMLPHAGFGQDRAHVDLSTGVITHTLTFHEDPDASGWLLLDQEVPWAGGGRVAGRGLVFDEQGRLVASFTQDAMVRPARSAAPNQPARRVL